MIPRDSTPLQIGQRGRTRKSPLHGGTCRFSSDRYCPLWDMGLTGAQRRDRMVAEISERRSPKNQVSTFSDQSAPLPHAATLRAVAARQRGERAHGNQRVTRGERATRSDQPQGQRQRRSVRAGSGAQLYKMPCFDVGGRKTPRKRETPTKREWQAAPRAARPDKTTRFCSTAAVGKARRRRATNWATPPCARAPRLSRSCGLTVAFLCC